MRRISATEEHLIQIQAKIGKWNDFVRELQVPADIVPAMATGRLELLKLARPRALTEDECAVFYQLIGGLLETNQALQQHSSLIAGMAAEVRRGLGGIDGMAGRLDAYANFREPREDDTDD